MHEHSHALLYELHAEGLHDSYLVNGRCKHGYDMLSNGDAFDWLSQQPDHHPKHGSHDEATMWMGDRSIYFDEDWFTYVGQDRTGLTFGKFCKHINYAVEHYQACAP